MTGNHIGLEALSTLKAWASDNQARTLGLDPCDAEAVAAIARVAKGDKGLTDFYQLLEYELTVEDGAYIGKLLAFNKTVTELGYVQLWSRVRSLLPHLIPAALDHK